MTYIASCSLRNRFFFSKTPHFWSHIHLMNISRQICHQLTIEKENYIPVLCSIKKRNFSIKKCMARLYPFPYTIQLVRKWHSIFARPDDKDPSILPNGTRLNSLLYTDDLILISKSAEGLQKALSILAKICNEWLLSFNPKKTKVMIIAVMDTT